MKTFKKYYLKIFIGILFLIIIISSYYYHRSLNKSKMFSEESQKLAYSTCYNMDSELRSTNLNDYDQLIISTSKCLNTDPKVINP